MAYADDEGTVVTGRELMQVAIACMQAAFNADSPDSTLFRLAFGDDENKRFGLSIAQIAEGGKGESIDLDLVEGAQPPAPSAA